MSAADAVAGALLVALILYAVLGGADFGGGVWDLLAFGPRAERQRKLIEQAMAPVWEANHVWLILVVVLLFTAFPPAFAAIMTVLHVPLTLALVGIVLRGSAFVFRQYGGEGGVRAWGRVFAVASTSTPVFLGVSIAVLTTGAPRTLDARELVLGWVGVFPLCVGLFALALFAMLAAVFLTVEADSAELKEDFRRRALAAAGASAALAGLTALVSAPRLLVAASLLPGAGLVAALLLRRFRAARALAVALVALVVGGWGVGQYPYLLPPQHTVQSAAAPDATLALLLPALGAGALILFPSLYALLRVFKAAAPK